MPKVTVAIPTRDRPAYLSVLLASLLSQSFKDFDVLILENGASRSIPTQMFPLFPLMDTLGVVSGNSTGYLWLGDIGCSPSDAYNRGMLECSSKYILFVDDDMSLEPGYLSGMVESMEYLEAKQNEHAILCGVTPWMMSPWEGVGPDHIEEVPGAGSKIIQVSSLDHPRDGGGPRYAITARQNVRYATTGMTLRRSDVISPANFMMQPELYADWSDASSVNIFSDIFWSMKIQMFLKYSIWFDLRCNAWHLNAPSGGLRSEGQGFDKTGPNYDAHSKRVERIVRDYEAFNEQR